MIPYIVMYSIVIINAFLNNKKAKYISLMVFSFVILFYSLRQNLGSDWPHYEYYFDNIYSTGPELYKFEIGYRIINIIGKSIFNSYRYLVLVIGLFNGIVFWKATKTYSKNLGLALLLSLYFLFYPTLEAIRQSIPLFLFYYSLKYIETNKQKYFFINVIGLLFHYTAIITILFYYFYKYKKVRNIMLISLIAYSIIEPLFYRILSFFPLLASKYYWYFVVKAVENSIFSFKSLEGFLILIVYYVINKKSKVKKTYEYISINLVYMGLILQVTLGQFSNIIYRITYYTDIGVILFYLFLYDRFKQPLYRFFYIIVMIAYVTVRLWNIFPYDDPRFFYTVF